jgi:hypothetical protein
VVRLEDFALVCAGQVDGDETAVLKKFEQKTIVRQTLKIRLFVPKNDILLFREKVWDFFYHSIDSSPPRKFS